MLRNRFGLTAVTVAGTLALAGGATAGIHIFNFNLDADQAGTNSNAVGSAQLIYDDSTQLFDLDMMVFGIDLNDLLDVGPNATPVHIHNAPAGFNGPIVVDIGFMSSFFNDGQGIRMQIQGELFGGQQGNLFSDPNVNEVELFAQRLYVNIHTNDFPGGEIRGQIVPAPGALGLLTVAAFVSRRRRRA